MTFTPYTSLQQMFDIAAAHLIKQGRPARDDNGKCAYRAPDGCMCAVGALIPNELYDDSLEGRSSGHIVDKLGGQLFDEKLNHYQVHYLLSSLQITHDGYAVAEWRQRLRSVASEYELNTQVLDG